MPIDPISAVGAASSIITPAVNAISQIGMNKKSREHQAWMYDKQRADALADQAFQNEYNSPAAQMKRLKEAGLNPNLVYGNGGTQAPAAAVRSTPMGDWNPKAPQIDLSGLAQSLAMMYDLQKTQAQTDNLKAQLELVKAQTAGQWENVNLTQLHETGTDLQNQHSRYDLDFKQGQERTRKMKEEADLNKTLAETKVNLENNERQKLLTANTLAQGVEQILLMRLQQAKTTQEATEIKQRIILLKQDETLKKFETELNEGGITKTDPAYMRVAMKFLTSLP